MASLAEMKSALTDLEYTRSTIVDAMAQDESFNEDLVRKLAYLQGAIDGLNAQMQVPIEPERVKTPRMISFDEKGWPL